MPNDTTRWNVSVSRETDIAVRSFLAQRGVKKGEFSKFIKDAVKWRMLEQTMVEAHGKFSDLAPGALEWFASSDKIEIEQLLNESNTAKSLTCAGSAYKGLKIIAIETFSSCRGECHKWLASTRGDLLAGSYAGLQA